MGNANREGDGRWEKIELPTLNVEREKAQWSQWLMENGSLTAEARRAQRRV
jgi:chorismate-pyruvate lyase